MASNFVNKVGDLKKVELRSEAVLINRNNKPLHNVIFIASANAVHV